MNRALTTAVIGIGAAQAMKLPLYVFVQLKNGIGRN